MSYILEETSKLVDTESRGKLTKELLQYHSKSELFGSEYLWTNEVIKNPIIWWEVMQIETPIIGVIASKLMLIPASSAAAERNWSHFGFIHNLRRNRLTNERVFKLISVYSNLHLISNSNRNRQNNNIQNIENDKDNIEISKDDELSEDSSDENSQELSSNDDYTDVNLSE